MLTKKQIIIFFKYFWKNITNEEIQILKWEKQWSLNLSKYSKNYLKKIKKYSWIFKISPFVQEVFICNTVAFWSAEKKSDIDLFIITKNWKIWTARLFLSLFIHFLWLRRYWNKTEWRFCLSFWATESWAFNLQNIELKEWKDPYFAIWTATLIPILWNQNQIKKIQEKNKWIKKYWIDFVYKNLKNNNKKSLIQIFFEKLFWTGFVEKILKQILKKRSLNKTKKIKDKSWVIISDEILKFHNKDKRKKIQLLVK